MLTCIACSKHFSGNAASTANSLADTDDDIDTSATPNTHQSLKALTSQIKDMALKASGAYCHCSNPCNGSSNQNPRSVDSDSAVWGSDRFRYCYKRAADQPSMGSMPRFWTSRFSSVDGTPNSGNARIVEEEVMVVGYGEEVKEWVAQVEPRVLITFGSLQEGGNDLKRIRFSRERFGEMHARLWWEENRARIHEQYLWKKIGK